MGRGVREPGRHLKIDLVSGSKLIRASQVQDPPRPTTVREIPGIFEERIPRLAQLTIDKECGLAGEVVLARLGGPIERSLTARCPIRGRLAGLGELEAGIVAVTGDGLGAAGKAQEKNTREVEAATDWTELVFNSDGDVTKAGKRRA